jgi:hypothetical protein
MNKPEVAKRLEQCAGQDFYSRDCRVTNPHITARESIELADYIAAVEAERDALAAQVNILRKAIIDATNNGAVTDTGKWVYRIDDSVLDKTPAQCLAERDAEVAAKAVDDCKSKHKHNMDLMRALYYAPSSPVSAKKALEIENWFIALELSRQSTKERHQC